MPAYQDEAVDGKLHTVKLMEVGLPEGDEKPMEVDAEVEEELMEIDQPPSGQNHR